LNNITETFCARFPERYIQSLRCQWKRM